MSQEENNGNELRHATAATLAPPPLACPGMQEARYITENQRGRGEGRGGRGRRQKGRGEEEEEERGEMEGSREGPSKTAQDAGAVTLRRKVNRLGWVLGMVLKAAEGKGWGASLCEWMLLDSCSV